MGTVAFRQNSTHLVRCDLCHKPTHQVYKIRLGEYLYTFCGGICADKAQKNFEYKTKNGISPSNPEPIDDEGAYEPE